MNYKHGFTERPKRTKNNPEWRAHCAWLSMRARCKGTTSKSDLPNYKNRGIQVEPRWNVFENFLADMGLPGEGLTLERKDNDKGYFKDNCKWATRSEQARNRRSNHILEFNGERKAIWQWAEDMGLKNSRILRVRLWRGWSVERTLTTKA